MQAYGALIRGLAAVPGVVAVGAGRTPLFTGGRSDGVLTIDGALPTATGEQPFTFFNAVTPGYFEALGIPIKAGAAYDWRDWGSGKRLALVNEVVTAAYFERTAPLDRMIGRGTRAATDNRIVGVFGNARYHDVRGEIPPQTYPNLDSVMEGVGRVSVYARVTGDPAQIMPLLRDEARRIDPNFVITEHADPRRADRLPHVERADAVVPVDRVCAAGDGPGGGRRTRRAGVPDRQADARIGVRDGARRRPRPHRRLVTREMALVILAGLAGGVAAAYAGGRYVQSQLFELRADDPLVFAVAVTTLLGRVRLATLMPALRASRMNVVRALRCE